METISVCLLQPLSLSDRTLQRKVSPTLHPGLIALPSASKESYSKGQVWVWKREEAN